ncbi:MAG: hypothetical protein GXO76_05685 [Calditrichaeota bacterium]|nr:hypothetical protein [Calditrichota bacterium]
MIVKTVRPLIEKNEAEQKLTPKQRFFFRRKKRLQKIERVDLPYFWVRVETEFKQKKEALAVAVDALEGIAVFPKEEFVQFEEKELAHPIPFQLTEKGVETAVFEAVKDFSIQVGIREKLPLKIGKILSIERVYYPFWMAYYSTPKGFTFTALDAVSGAVQGVKMRQVFVKMLKMLQDAGDS